MTPQEPLAEVPPQGEDLADEIRRGQSHSHPIRRRMRAFQDWSHRGSRLRRTLVVGLISVAGFVLLMAGVIMWFIPGPGWLFVFLGIGVWSLEFAWAERLNHWALHQVTRLWTWWKGTRAADWWRWCLSGAAERSVELRRRPRRSERAAACAAALIMQPRVPDEGLLEPLVVGAQGSASAALRGRTGTSGGAQRRVRLTALRWRCAACGAAARPRPTAAGRPP
ncbi:PGPGW domain-containing protein [Kocuria sp. SL71]|uniref:PGPGW domain-containing protein n=1 Tax=Kocuria sp. SL71 TaxID=2995151 RepID=UPI002275FA84|nr:PGPGW domain-containing protein [Kocuria sp. SL71]MCY1684304.1 PGPGW domain-containing protein [Kocuria sp. SL71]